MIRGSHWLVLGTASLSYPLAVSAQPVTASPESPSIASAGAVSSETEGEIIVVGSRLRGGPPQTEAVPIGIVTSESIARSGSTTTQEVLTRTTSSFGAAVADGRGDTDGGRAAGNATVNLKGIGDRYTLVLVNGRRIRGSGPANLNFIPASAIERVEILKTGASAIYGSDALAGVVNIVLKKRADGFGALVNYGHVDNGGMETREYALSFGTSTDTTRVFVTLNRFERDPLLASDRIIDSSNDQRRFGSVDFRSSQTSPANFLLNGQRLILNTDRIGVGQFSLNPADYRAYDANRDNYDRPRNVPVSVINRSRRTSGFASVEQDLATNTTLFADLLYKRDNAEDTSGGQGVNFGTGGLINVPATNPYNPFGVQITGLRVRLDEFGPGVFHYDYEEYRVSGGLRTKFFESWSADLSVEQYRGKNVADQRGQLQYSVAGLNAALNRTGATALNPFCNRCNTPQQLAGIFQGGAVTRIDKNLAVNIAANGELINLPAGPALVALGAEYRKVNGDTLYSSTLQFGTNTRGDAQVNLLGKRDIKAVFAEAKIPIIGNGILNNNRVQLNVAARYEDYSDFGSVFNPALSIFAEVIPGNVLVRSSYNRSFNAPFFTETNPNETSVFNNQLDPRDGRVKLGTTVTGGNTSLKPETADNFAAGIVFQPASVRGLRLSADYFITRQKNLIVTPNLASILLGRVTPAKPFLSGTNADGRGGEFLVFTAPVNAGRRNFQNVEIDGTYNFSRGDVSLSTEMSASYLIKYKVDLSNGVGFRSLRGIYDNQFGPLPKWKTQVSQTVDWRGLSTTVRWNHISSLADSEPGQTPGTFRVGSYNSFDLGFIAELGEKGLRLFGPGLKGVQLRAGAINFLDEKVPFVHAVSAQSDPYGLYDRRERFFYAGLAVAF